ncbi:MAG: acyl-CoA dehydratase activase [bacterium]
MITIGIDIGSRTSKAVLLRDGRIIADTICESEIKMSNRGQHVLEELLKKAGLNRGQIDYIVATGYGRITLPFADQTVTEITCHAKGIHTLCPTVRTVIDIGGQDSKVIRVNSAGEIVDFAMNDRCAAGTGKFLEVTSKVMGLTLEDFSRLYFKSAEPCKISSMCTVFAESEIISLQAEGVKDEDIAAGLILATARRVANMAKSHSVEPDIAFTGGVAKNRGICAALESEVGRSFLKFKYDPQLIGAYGAALIASEQAGQKKDIVPAGKKKDLDTITELDMLLKKRPGEIEKLRESGVKIVGYFCGYVPVEIIMAAGMVPVRLIRGGDVEVSSIGNRYLTSSACPFACACVGNKQKKGDFYFESVDIVADAPSCLQMKRVLEIWEKYFSTRIIHIGFSRKYYTKEGLDYFIKSIYNFKAELEDISGSKIEPENIRKAVAVTNEIRGLERLLYEKIKDSGISWYELIKFINAGNVLDKTVYLDLLKKLAGEIESRPKAGPPKLRILITGGMLAPGDEKLLKIMRSLKVDFVMDELCSGSRLTFVDIKEPTIENIAHSYLKNVPCGSLPYHDFKSDPRIFHLDKLLSEYNINGILYYTLRFCDAYSFKFNEMKNHAKKKGVPILHLHSDYSGADTGQIKTRIEAFIETILNSKKGDKNEAF